VTQVVKIQVCEQVKEASGLKAPMQHDEREETIPAGKHNLKRAVGAKRAKQRRGG
jgi:hypothetical protein